jgi:hypothetical protein
MYYSPSKSELIEKSVYNSVKDNQFDFQTEHERIKKNTAVQKIKNSKVNKIPYNELSKITIPISERAVSKKPVLNRDDKVEYYLRDSITYTLENKINEPKNPFHDDYAIPGTSKITKTIDATLCEMMVNPFEESEFITHDKISFLDYESAEDNDTLYPTEYKPDSFLKQFSKNIIKVFKKISRNLTKSKAESELTLFPEETSIDSCTSLETYDSNFIRLDYGQSVKLSDSYTSIISNDCQVLKVHSAQKFKRLCSDNSERIWEKTGKIPTLQ